MDVHLFSIRLLNVSVLQRCGSDYNFHLFVPSDFDLWPQICLLFFLCPVSCVCFYGCLSGCK